jgi:predicted 2-oxoglutarate/Fe(II)-dependent dioxygenase YbiX/peroxiredoxin
LADPAAAAPPLRAAPLQPGDRMPHFTGRTAANPQFRVDSVAGRWIVVGILGSLAAEDAQARLRAVIAADDLFDDTRACLFLATQDPGDERARRLADRLPGRRVLWDDTAAVARLFGTLDAAPGAGPRVLPAWFVIDPGLTVRATIPFQPDGSDAALLLARLRALPPPDGWMGFDMPAPVLILPDVFEPAFCDRLVALYEATGGEVSGFMRDRGGQTVAVHDPSFKVRRDVLLSDPELIRATQARIHRRVVPQIERVHFFRATRMERYLVACYDSAEGGHFRPHRDNTTLGTAHRRFAVSINLTDDFEGGAVSFPEYNPRGYKAPRGAAVVFSCALLHAVGPVTAGRRYAFLPFLYDDEAARLRERNAARVPTAQGYRADQRQ